jgi:hypothetical protein
MGRHKDTDWGVIATIAKEKGAKYHDLVSAQWALESGWGSKLTGPQQCLRAQRDRRRQFEPHLHP